MKKPFIGPEPASEVLIEKRKLDTVWGRECSSKNVAHNLVRIDELTK